MTEEGKDTFTCEYVAPLEGAYKVDVKFDGSPVPGSPFPVEVAKPGDAGKCKAQGDGLETAIIDQLAEFDVDCKSAGKIKLAEKIGSFLGTLPCKLALRAEAHGSSGMGCRGLHRCAIMQLSQHR